MCTSYLLAHNDYNGWIWPKNFVMIVPMSQDKNSQEALSRISQAKSWPKRDLTTYLLRVLATRQISAFVEWIEREADLYFRPHYRFLLPAELRLNASCEWVVCRCPSDATGIQGHPFENMEDGLCFQSLCCQGLLYTFEWEMRRRKVLLDTKSGRM